MILLDICEAGPNKLVGPNKLPQARISYNLSFLGPDKLRIGPDKLSVGPDKLRVGPDKLRKHKNWSGRIS